MRRSAVRFRAPAPRIAALFRVRGRPEVTANIGGMRTGRLRIAVGASALVLSLFAVAILVSASPRTRGIGSASVSRERADLTGLTPASSLIGGHIQLRILAPRHLGVASAVGSDRTSVISA